jgi:ATP-binding cassette subfamily B protein
MGKFKFIKQYDMMDCGPSCLRMIASYHGKSISQSYIKGITKFSRTGVSLLNISEAADEIGLDTLAATLTLRQLAEEAPLPCILHWQKKHFVVLKEIKKSLVKRNESQFVVADPASGVITYSKEEFIKNWVLGGTDNDKGVVLLLEPGERFHELKQDESHYDISYIFKYFGKERRLITQLILGLFLSSTIQIIFPFLTQSIIDVGISTGNMSFIYLILIAQLFLLGSRIVIDFLRSWILLHISTKLNISLLKEFLSKLMKLPLLFFETRLYGDIMQRMQDHKRIESFLTVTFLNTVFSFVNIVVFSLILINYNRDIFILYGFSSILYISWITLFLNARKKNDLARFDALSKDQNKLLQIVQGIQEIKLNNNEYQKKKEWEALQVKIFKVHFKDLSIQQFQKTGAFFINEGKNIFITVLVAKGVIDGQLTIGSMLAIQYIIAQLNSPLDQITSFIQGYQDSKLSIERIKEVQEVKDEEPDNNSKVFNFDSDKSIVASNIHFSYPGRSKVLNNASFKIPEGKVTAIVGLSGGGKTTILKLLLKFYEPDEGNIKVGDLKLSNISNKYWRSRCGVVMQDGYIFSDTIANNICMDETSCDHKRLIYAAKIANILDFIEELPEGFNSKIGSEGYSLSQGQKQRVLIARAVYKDPEYIFLDEATNALDVSNESSIMNNLVDFFKGKTVVIVAHRLSTIKNADQILVLNNGLVCEAGDHLELTNQKGIYYQLVEKQLNLI